MAWLARDRRTSLSGDEVRDAFVAVQPQAAEAFVAGADGKWMADIYQLARLRLQALGVKRIYGGDLCTFVMPSVSIHIGVTE